MVEQIDEIEERMESVDAVVEHIERKLVSILDLVIQYVRRQEDADPADIAMLERELADKRRSG